MLMYIPLPMYTHIYATTVSLAATKVIAFAFFSSSYLDVSIHWVNFKLFMNLTTNVKSFLIRASLDQSSFSAS